jgi:crossover junction endodeoxyribonuclease RusA
MKITFPWYPRELSPNWVGHFHTKAKYKSFYKQVCKEQTIQIMDQIKLAKNQEYTEMYITFTPPDRRWRDSDNMLASIKSGLDGMCEALEINDKCFEHIHIHRLKEIGGFITVQLK